MTNTDAALGDRAQQLLRVMIERFIESGKPVGSRILSRESGIDLSPATVRNVMADLEDLGLVTSPHTSSGRVPTVSGYRLFLNSLLTVTPFDNREVEALKRKLQVEGSEQSIVESASGLLSGVSQMAGIVTIPRHEQVSFKQVEFVPLSENRVLAVLVTNNDEVHNRVLTPNREYSRAELIEASNYLNEQFAGKDMDTVRQEMLVEMQEARADMNRLMLAAIDMGEKLLDIEQDDNFVLAGQNNLMDFSELSNVEQLRLLFDAFQQKQQILGLLEQCLHADGVQIFIGEESGFKVLDGCSVVTAPYTVDNEVVGVLGVIGPTRMAYQRVIPLVDVTAKLLGAALNSKNSSPDSN